MFDAGDFEGYRQALRQYMSPVVDRVRTRVTKEGNLGWASFTVPAYVAIGEYTLGLSRIEFEVERGPRGEGEEGTDGEEDAMKWLEAEVQADKRHWLKVLTSEPRDSLREFDDMKRDIWFHKPPRPMFQIGCSVITLFRAQLDISVSFWTGTAATLQTYRGRIKAEKEAAEARKRLERNETRRKKYQARKKSKIRAIEA
jgi:hypothetical protein